MDTFQETFLGKQTVKLFVLFRFQNKLVFLSHRGGAQLMNVFELEASGFKLWTSP